LRTNSDAQLFILSAVIRFSLYLEVKIAATCKYDSDIQGVQKVAVHQAAVSSDRPCMLHVLKTAITAYIRNISQADLQKVLVKKIKRV
jgi:hypothetical protein